MRIENLELSLGHPQGAKPGPPPGVPKTAIYQELGAILGGPGPAFPAPSRRIGGLPGLPGRN